MLTRLPNRQWNEEQRRLALHRAYSLILSWPANETMVPVQAETPQNVLEIIQTAAPDRAVGISWPTVL